MNGEHTGSAWGVTDLSVKFHLPEKLFDRALEVLCSEKVGWIKMVESPCGNRAVTVQSPLGTLKEEKEENRIERSTPPPPEPKNNARDESVTHGDACDACDAMQKQKHIPYPQKGDGRGILDCKVRIGMLFKRKPDSHWKHIEESALCEVFKRPDFHSELEDIIGAYDRKVDYLSMSVEACLTIG
jgi:hypothetical protein